MTASLDVIRAKHRVTRERILTLVESLDDAQLAWRPDPKAHNIGFALWHTARSGDNVQADLGAAETIWARDGYAARWTHPERGVGTGWDDEKAAALPLPPKGELIGYARAVFAAIDAGLVAVDETRLNERVKSRFMGEESPLGEIIGSSLMHDNRHLGEMEYIKGLLGLRGTVTR